MHNSLDWKSSEDTRDIVHMIVQALVEGRRVALPAETAYHAVASGLNAEAAEYFQQMRDNEQISRCCLLLRSYQELLDYVPDLSTTAARIASRAWPGPLMMELPIDPSRSLLSRLPSQVRDLLCQDNWAAFRVATHEAIRQALRLMPGPLLAAPLRNDGGPARTVKEIAQSAPFSFVVDDGQTQFNDFATHLKVDGNRCQVLRQGAYQPDAITRSAQYIVLLVCTGNTCRSPMAEVMMREMFVKRFGEEAAKKVFIASGGLNAYPGGSASVEAQAAMSDRGLSLEDHQSRSITTHALQTSDLILTMTRTHRHSILDQFPEIESKVHLVSGNSTDVSDPFGGPQSVYTACADQLEVFLRSWVERLDDSLFPQWV